MDGWIIGVVAGLVVGVVNVVGGGFVIKRLVGQIKALKGTIDAQETTLKTIGEVNKTVLEVFKATDPERWSKEVQIHKELADKKANAIIEEERRKLEQGHAAFKDSALKALNTLVGHYGHAVGVAMKLIPYVPKGMRRGLIKEAAADGPEFTQKALLEIAETAPDWSAGRGLARLLRGDFEETLFKSRADAPSVTPPTLKDVRSEGQ